MRSGARALAPAAVLLLGLLGLLRATPAPAQELRVSVTDTARVTVGDPLTLEVRARLPERAEVVDRAPGPRDPNLPEGFRILSSESPTRLEGDTLTGRMRVAFFRPGRQAVPQLALAYRPAPGSPVDTLLSQPVTVEIVPVLPPGDQALKDIKDLVPLPGRSRLLVWLVLAAAALLAAYAIYRRLRRPTPVPVPPPPVPAVEGRSAYELALERLAEVERARLPARGEVTRHYVLVADTLRRYLEEGQGVPALERTTSELVWALPPHLSANGLREACRDLLDEADLVKFARLVPVEAAAWEFLARARTTLDRWESARRALRASEPAAARASSNGSPGAGIAGDAEAARVAGPAGDAPAGAQRGGAGVDLR